MELSIAGKTALVFGGSEGLGRACVRQLAQAGVCTTIAARTYTTLAPAAAEPSKETGFRMEIAVADITTAAALVHGGGPPVGRMVIFNPD